MTTQQQPVSVGQLLAMSPDARTERIRSLSPEVRMKLAHLASLGARVCSVRALEFLGSGRLPWAREQMNSARDRSDLAADLTAALTAEEL